MHLNANQNPTQHMLQSEYARLCDGNQYERAGPTQTLISQIYYMNTGGIVLLHFCSLCPHRDYSVGGICGCCLWRCRHQSSVAPAIKQGKFQLQAEHWRWSSDLSGETGSVSRNYCVTQSGFSDPKSRAGTEVLQSKFTKFSKLVPQRPDQHANNYSYIITIKTC